MVGLFLLFAVFVCVGFGCAASPRYFQDVPALILILLVVYMMGNVGLGPLSVCCLFPLGLGLVL